MYKQPPKCQKVTYIKKTKKESLFGLQIETGSVSVYMLPQQN